MVDKLGTSEASEGLDFSAEFTLAELKLIGQLKNGDFEKYQSVRAAYVAWVDAQQLEAQKDGTPTGNNKFLMKKAKLLFMAGFYNEAGQDWQDLQDLAFNLGDQALVDECNKFMDAISQ